MVERVNVLIAAMLLMIVVMLGLVAMAVDDVVTTLRLMDVACQ